MKRLALFVSFTLLTLCAGLAREQKEEILSEDEQDRLREAQDPSERIEVYLSLAQERLGRFDMNRTGYADPKEDRGASLGLLLGEYVGIYDELKNWIDAQYHRKGDMRRGLRSLLEQGPRQLEMLRHIDQSPDRYREVYRETLREAIDDLTDTLDGATRALADQEKKFTELKREEKTAARIAKEQRKEEEKRNREEKKLRKHQKKRGVPGDADQD